MAVRRKHEAEIAEAKAIAAEAMNADQKLEVVAELYSAALRLPVTDDAVINRAKRFLAVMGLTAGQSTSSQPQPSPEAQTEQSL